MDNNTTYKDMYNGCKTSVIGFWNRHGAKIVLGAKCVAVGLLVGYCKGCIDTMDQISPVRIATAMADALPAAPVAPALEDVDVEDVLDGMTLNEVREIVDEMIKDGRIEVGTF